MKKIYLIAWLGFLGGGLPAQTNVPATPPTSRPPTRINSDHGEFDLSARRAIYYDHVRVEDPRMTLTCDRLTADLPQSEAQERHIVAETNVVIYAVDEKGQTNHATSDRAIYDYRVEAGVTNETVTLTGHAMMESAQGTLTGEPIFWDRTRNRLTATDQKMVFRQNISPAATHTNAAPAQAPAPAAPVRTGTEINSNSVTPP